MDDRSKVHGDALRLIYRSSVADFGDSLRWGQWQRRVAEAALMDDQEALESLAEEAPIAARLAAKGTA